MVDFTKLNLKQDIIDVLTSLNFKDAFEVQAKVVPIATQGTNVVFTSRTGSGKTLAYLLGFLSKINKKQGLQMLVLVPTRELCVQVGKEMKKVTESLGINVGMLYGGREISGDRKTLTRKNQIIVGTPGRLLQHVDSKTIKVGEVKYLVYDESDQMFDHGFFEECLYLRERVSKNAQIILSSATITDKVEEFIQLFEHKFLQIGDLIPKNILQEKTYCEKDEKNDLLMKFFKDRFFQRVMIFCNTKKKSYDIQEFLSEHKLNAKSLNGNLTQTERTNTLNLFKAGKIKILVTTDVAARGLHIEAVDIIINYDVPTKEEFYVHRIGRTGRVDKAGYSLTLICPEDVERFANLEEKYELIVGDLNTSTNL